MWYGMFGKLGSFAHLCLLPSYFALPVLFTLGPGRKPEALMYITVQQKLGQECVNSIVLDKNLKHSIIWDAMKKITSCSSHV